jgi:hypothetical protein
MMTDTAGVYVGGLAYQCTYTPYSKEEEVSHVFSLSSYLPSPCPPLTSVHIGSLTHRETQREVRMVDIPDVIGGEEGG